MAIYVYRIRGQAINVASTRFITLPGSWTGGPWIRAGTSTASTEASKRPGYHKLTYQVIVNPRVAIWVAVHRRPTRFTWVRTCGLTCGANAYEPGGRATLKLSIRSVGATAAQQAKPKAVQHSNTATPPTASDRVGCYGTPTCPNDLERPRRQEFASRDHSGQCDQEAKGCVYVLFQEAATQLKAVVERRRDVEGARLRP